MLCKEILGFLSENNSEKNSENTVFIFTVCKKGLFMNSRLTVLPKRFRML